jgi:hypothetical protein
MKVIVLKGELTRRDAELYEIPRKFFSQVDLSVYRKSVEMKIARQEGTYKSRQGATITPVSLWPIEFQTVRRKVGTSYQSLPAKEEGLYLVKTARWASEVVGTGVEKEKWRGLFLGGKCSLPNIFVVVSSAWLVPFALAHRYLVHIPAEIKGKGKAAAITVRHDFAEYRNRRLKLWTNQETAPSEGAIRDWTIQAQKAWNERKTDKSAKLVTERLDYHGTLASQKPKAFRVVHTRSRSFYASVLNPRAHTALGLPFDAVKINTTEGGMIINTTYLPIGGVICDNLLHSVVVDSEDEAYWMMGLFNSKVFCRRVMKKALGEPPGIYTIPVKIMDALNLEFDPSKRLHLELAKIAHLLEEKMNVTLQTYLTEEKGINLEFVDDTDQSPDIPSTISSALMRRLNANIELKQLEDLTSKILKS